MPIFFERMGSRESTVGKDAACRLMYFFSGTEDDQFVRNFAYENTPATYPPNTPNALIRQRIQCSPQGNGVWYIGADYAFGERMTTSDPGNPGGGESPPSGGDNDPLGPGVRVSITGVSQHINLALSTPGQYKRTDDPNPIPDHENIIGFRRSGSSGYEAKGTEIILPSETYTESWRFNSQFITLTYKRTVRSCIGKYNMFKFRGDDAGEVMFMGADISNDGGSETKIDYTFKSEPNAIVSGGVDYRIQIPNFPPIEKLGHQYIEFEYEEQPGANNGQGVPTAILPKLKYVRVFEVGRYSAITTNQKDFSVLGIGS